MSDYDREFQCREIITRAVCGSGKKFAQAVHRLHTPNRPSSILGAWVINHQYAAVRFQEGVEIEGSYDLNIWYSYDGNTKTDVAKESVSYTEQVPLQDLDDKHLAQTAKVFAEALQHPSCVEATIDQADDSVMITIEREFRAELVAETKLCVVVCQGGCGDEDKELPFEDDLDEYDDLEDDLYDDEDEQS